MKGRKPLPTEIKRTRGTLRKHRTTDGEMELPTVNSDLPAPPEWLTDNGKAEWITVTSDLNKAGILAYADLSLVAMYCNEISTYIECQEQMAKMSTRVMVIKDDAGKVKYAQQLPYQKIANDCVEKALKLAAEFGLTPSARTRIGTLTKDKKGDKKGWADLINQFNA